MKTCSKCKEEKLFSEFSKNKTRKDGYNHICKLCVIEYKQKNKARIALYVKEHYVTNKEKILAYQEEYAKLNKVKIAIRKKKSNKKYRELNKCKIAALMAKRRASKLNATPNWLTKEQMDEITEMYEIARAFRLYTGSEYHVDHIVPLQGKNVSGLHVPWNLQILEASENRIKSNKH